MSDFKLKTIAHIYNDFDGKFGIPRQSGIVEAVQSRVVFEPEYRREEALRGLEGFSHLWLIWQFSENVSAAPGGWSPTVRPPRLGGNQRVGVFASRSPFRPNPLGLSVVRLLEIRQEDELGAVLVVAGADLLSGTPIFDIKPYVPYCDSVADARGGFAVPADGHVLQVEVSEEQLAVVPPEKRAGLLAVLAQDPRPSYQHDPERVYGMGFAGLNVRFRVGGDNNNILTVVSIEAEGQ
jgi:tRNA-Thr(GGU) m(6)t(6)A37 methyltransferase TsaA